MTGVLRNDATRFLFGFFLLRKISPAHLKLCMNLLIENATLLTVDPTDTVHANAPLAIAEDRLVGVGSIPEGFVADEVLDGTDHLVLPGLINAHTHIPMALFRNYADDLPFWPWLMDRIKPLEDHLSAEHVYAGTRLGILELLQAGVTSFLDMYFFMDQVARGVEESGIRACLCGGLLDPTPGLGGFLFKEATQLHDTWQGKAEGRVTVQLGPHSPYLCSAGYLKEAAAEAQRRGIGLHIHLSESRQEVTTSLETHGKTPVQYLTDLGILEQPTAAAHCVHVDEADQRLLAEHPVTVLHNPTSNLKLANGVAPIPALQAKGVTVALGTDGHASNNNVNLFEELHLAALLHKGIQADAEAVPAATAIRMATLNGARALGLEQEIGSLEVGKKADVILLDARKPHYWPRHNPVAAVTYSAQAADVRHVLINGRWVVKDYVVQTLDPSVVLQEGEAMAQDLVRRATA